MADTRFIITSLRQMLNDLSKQEETVAAASGDAHRSPQVRNHSAYLHGMALLTFRQAVVDVFEAFRPDGCDRWPSLMLPLLRDAEFRPGSDPGDTPGGSPFLAAYTGAAYFVGLMASRYRPSSGLAATSGGDEPGAGQLLALLQQQEMIEDVSEPLLDLIPTVTSGGGIRDLLEMIGLWERQVLALAEFVAEHGVDGPAADDAHDAARTAA